MLDRRGINHKRLRIMIWRPQVLRVGFHRPIRLTELASLT